MKKVLFNNFYFIFIFLFSIFALSNIGFIFNLPVSCFYILFGFLISFYLVFKKSNLKTAVISSLMFAGIFFLSLIFANLFIDTSFDGRCYHFTTEYLLKLGYNPIYQDINKFAENNNIYYNLLFSGSYPNLVETLRSCFYLIFQNMESSKVVNFLFIFSGLFYSLYFFTNYTNRLKSFILSFLILLCPVVICQMNTKMIDFILYYIFIIQLFSLISINKKRDEKINTLVFFLACIMAIAIKYIGILNTSVFFLFYLFNFSKTKLKFILLFILTSLVLCFQPYITNIIKFKNPFYPSLGYNKLDFMTKQNPKEFLNKPYIYKFVRSMFSSCSDSRMQNPETPPIFWKVPFTNHFDMPFATEDIRISGFGHLYSGVFILTFIFSLMIFKRKRGIYALGIIYLATFLNPICWWARFVPWLYLSSIFIAFYYRKINVIFYTFVILLCFNGLWTAKENLYVTAYKNYVMYNFYNNLYAKDKKISVYIDKTNYPEEDSTILVRMKEYGIDFELSDTKDDSYKQIKTDCTISKTHFIKD